MSLSGVDKLGDELGRIKQEQEVIELNLSPDDAEGFTAVAFFESLRLTGNIQLYSRRMSNVLIVEHPTYGVVETGAYPVGPFCVLDHPTWAVLDDCMLAETGDAYERTLLSTIDISTNTQYISTLLDIPITIPIIFMEIIA